MAVASGKGGTGKTFVSLNLFSSVSDALLVDCDVEEPNDNIFVQFNLEKKSNVEISRPKINSTSCSMCGLCIDECRYHALIEMIDTVYVSEDLCKGCGLCTMICPSQSITEVNSTIGEISIGKNSSDEIKFYQGELNIGQAMATPIIKDLLKNLPTNNEKTIVLDSPPGTACPVITTLSYADYVILVAEPTPYSLENIKQTVEMIKQLAIPIGIILNKSQEKYNSLIYDYANQEQIPLLLKIPFDKKFAELYSQGLILVDQIPEWKIHFQNVWNQIIEKLT